MSLKPFVQDFLYPIRYRNGSHVTTLADEIDDGPTFFPTLNVFESEVGQFSPAETTAEQDGNDGSVSLSFACFGVRRLP